MFVYLCMVYASPQKLARPLSWRSAHASNKSLCPSFTGKTGAIAHFLGKCFHPYLKDIAGTKLILYSDCDAPRFKFKLEDDGTLKHVVSGLCIVPQNPDPKPNTRVVLGTDCANAKYKGLKNGFIQHTASGMCIHYRSSDPTPVNGVDVVLFDDCVKNVKMLFAWEAAYKEGMASCELGCKSDQFQISPAASPKNISSHSIKNLAFHRLIITPIIILTTSSL